MRETGHNKASRAAALDGVGAPCARQPPPSRHIPCRSAPCARQSTPSRGILCGSAPCARQSTPSRGQGPLPQKQSSHKGKSAQVATRGRSHKSRHSHNGFGFGCCRSTPCARQAPQVAISLVGARPARDKAPQVAARGRSHKSTAPTRADTPTMALVLKSRPGAASTGADACT